MLRSELKTHIFVSENFIFDYYSVEEADSVMDDLEAVIRSQEDKIKALEDELKWTKLQLETLGNINLH